MLVLAYQPAVWGRCDGIITGMFGEAVMAESWEGVGKAAMAKNHKAQEGASGWCDAHTGSETLVSMLVETIKKPCSDLLAIHQRKCIFGKMEIF
jgi:hypothetical protein